jgi:hypothetical protein
MHVIFFADLPTSHPAYIEGAIGVAFASNTPWGDLPWTELDEQQYQAAVNATTVPPRPATPIPDWTILEELRNSPIFYKAFVAANNSLVVSNAFSLLRDALDLQNVADLRFAFNSLREGLAASPVGDFTSEELTWISAKLEEYGFDSAGFNLDA